MGVSSLVLFMNSLEFCNAVVQVAHPLVRSQLLDYLHNGFLVPVMGPALHKVQYERDGLSQTSLSPVYFQTIFMLENSFHGSFFARLCGPQTMHGQIPVRFFFFCDLDKLIL